MDGNKRWSNKNNLDLNKSYQYGVENLLKIADHCFFSHNINYVSAFALSTHNLSRSKKVILTIFKLIDLYLDEFLTNAGKYKFNIRFIGNFEIFNVNTIVKLKKINNTKNFDKTLIIALNYSGSEDIINAVNLFINNKKKLPFSDFLSTSQWPYPDLLIRTGGYQRLSDYFLFQISFTELFFSKTLWPDIKLEAINKIINKYLKIERKYGK
jgi:undecaprenyl diphosphate synthase